MTGISAQWRSWTKRKDACVSWVEVCCCVVCHHLLYTIKRRPCTIARGPINKLLEQTRHTPNTTMPRSALRIHTTTTVEHCKHNDAERWRLNSTHKLTLDNTCFNTKHLHDATAVDAALADIGVGVLVSVCGLREEPPDLCTVLQVNRSTVDVLRLSIGPRTCAEYSPIFTVDFFSFRLLTGTRDVGSGHIIIIAAGATSTTVPVLTASPIPATPTPHDCPCACEGS